MAVLDDLSRFEFENLMGDVLRALGYGNIRQANRTADEGRDVLMEEVVAETDACDFLVEQGLLVGTTENFAKSHGLKREYDDEECPFGGMQDGVLELLENEERLYRWEIDANLVDVSESLP